MANATTTTPKSYTVEMVFNGETFKKKSTDLFNAIESMKPEVCHTEAFITITKGLYVFERRLNLKQLKQLFNNEDVLRAFITNILV